jgi:hypothetical protein
MSIPQYPWFVPQPIKESSFVSLHPAHQKFNVEIDLAKVGAFSNQKKSTKRTELLYSDLQSNADINVAMRLGSGRSGVYLDHYLKGMGRTTLAANWNVTADLYHSSGMLLASSGVREYLLSRYLASLGKSHLINPCTGLLMKKLPKGFDDHLKNVFRARPSERPTPLPQADANLHAISVKSGKFARFSNFTWWLCNFPQENHPHGSGIGDFFELFYLALLGFPEKNADPDPKMIAETFAKTVSQTITHFLEAWELGISWGSLHNNFTMDGKYLDLETPTLLPFQIVGTFGFKKNNLKNVEKISIDSPTHLHGFEVIFYIRQLQAFLLFLRSRMDFFLKAGVVDAREKEFIQEFLVALKESFGREHLLLSQSNLSYFVISHLADIMDLGSQEKSFLKSHFDALLQELPFWSNHSRPKKSPQSTHFYKMEMNLARTEPHRKRVVYVPSFLRDRNLIRSSAAETFNERLNQADEMKKIGELYSLLKKADLAFFKK